MSSGGHGPDLTDRLLDDALKGPVLPAHLYFHVPFCRSKCSYCDFYSVTRTDSGLVRAVFSGLRAEVHRWASACLPGVIDSVYVGGGTPTMHAEEVARLLRWTLRQLPVREGAEVTVEANPDSLSREALDDLQLAGVTRISVGVQSFDDTVLSMLGRAHTATQAREACEMVNSAGLELSVDLICGTAPHAGVSKPWQRSLYEVVGTGATHVSVYPLQLEANTPMAAAVETGLLELPDEDQVADELEYGAARLEQAGLARYEVANYAVPGHESVHNTAYWLGRSYLGIGPAAHGMLDCKTAEMVGLATSIPTGSRVRYSAPRSIEAWLTGAGNEVEILTPRQAEREDVMLGLRLVRGVGVDLVFCADLTDVLVSLQRDGLVENVESAGGNRWRTTPRGWLLGNEVFGRIWNADDADDGAPEVG